MRISPFDRHAQGGQNFVVAEWTEGPCPADGPMWVAPLHRHHSCEEAWYILQGRLSFLVDGEELTAGVGDLVWVSPGSVHTYWNPDQAPARYLLLMTAKTQALIEAIHSASDRSEAGLKALFASFDTEFLGWKA